MNGNDKLAAVVLEAHNDGEYKYPYVAIIAKSTQDMERGDYVAICEGDSAGVAAYLARCDALKSVCCHKRDWALRVYHLGQDGNFMDPTLLSLRDLTILMQDGVREIEYAQADGSILKQ